MGSLYESIKKNHQSETMLDFLDSNAMDGYQGTPSQFFRTRYPELVRFCAGSESEETLLYQYFDKLNQFPYSAGWDRRTVRTNLYIEPVDKIKIILRASCYFQKYGISLDKYLLNEMSEELVDKKIHQNSIEGVADLIAAHLDAGDLAVKEALIRIITGDNQIAFLTIEIIRGIMRSNDQDLHQILGQLLLAARLQEGIRQAICENMDCGTISAFRVLFQVIEENDLLRFSAVRRAAASWIGVLDTDHLVRSSNKIFQLMKKVVWDKQYAEKLTDSDDVVEILAGLWGLGFYEIKDAVIVMERLADYGTIQQKRVAAYYNAALSNIKMEQHFANKMIASQDLSPELAALIMNTYMRGCDSESGLAAGIMTGEENKPRPVNWKLWFEDQTEARCQMECLLRLLDQMERKKLIFESSVFPWYTVSLTKGEVLLRICAIANGLEDHDQMDCLAARLTEADSQYGHRRLIAGLLFSGDLTPRRRGILIKTLGDKDINTRNMVFRLADRMTFTPEEYDQICQLLRLKSSDLRIRLISLIRKQSSDGLCRSLKILLKDRREEMRLAGLDMVRSLIEEQENGNGTRENMERLLAVGKRLAQEIESPTEREQIYIREMFPIKGHNEKTQCLYTETDTIKIDEVSCNISDYPLFHITEKRLKELFTKLTDLIEWQEQESLTDVLREFYEREVCSQEDLMALYLALLPYQIRVYEGLEQDSYVEQSNTHAHACTVFSSAIVDFTPLYCVNSYGDSELSKVTRELKLLMQLCVSPDYRRTLGQQTARYLCAAVSVEERIIPVRIPVKEKYYASFLGSPLFSGAIGGLMDYWNDKEEYNERFTLMIQIHALYATVPADMEAGKIINLDNTIRLTAADYVTAAYYGIITEEQLFYTIFETGSLRDHLQNLFLIYLTEKFPSWNHMIQKYGVFENERLKRYWKEMANQAANRIVELECRRGDGETKYSRVVTAIECFYGIDHLVKLLTAMDGETFVRRDNWGLSVNASRKRNLSYLISVCHPLPEDTTETFRQALSGTSIEEQRLIEAAMYAPQWIDLIEGYLDFKGLRMGVYYFMAHMNDADNLDERRFSEIARFTPLEREALLQGAFDVDWFQEAYALLGEKRFAMLYDAAKYVSDGSRHTRARKYVDAALGKVTVTELEAEITAKRSKDLLMSYPLIPLRDREDLLHRYQFIQNFRKESSRFSSQRRAGEGLACDMAMQNLAMRAGCKDTVRLLLHMERILTENFQSENNRKKLKEQYSRLVKMFEKSMEERELYTMREIMDLRNNPVIWSIIENLLFISDRYEICGSIRIDGGVGLADFSGKIWDLTEESKIRVLHPYDLYRTGNWAAWQRHFFEKQRADGSRQPFRQVFRELYVKLDEELSQKHSRLFAGYQIQPAKTMAVLKNRHWIADPESGLEKIFYKDNIVVTMYAMADWFSPSDIEAPVLEYVTFSERKSGRLIPIKEVPDIVYSETMRDVDLAVSVAHAGNVDPETSHSTVEMRRVIVQCNIELFGLKNVILEGSHALIHGNLGEYTVHLGSGTVHMKGVHQLNVLPVHSQHRGKIFLPFLDSDPKTAEIVSKILLFSRDKKIKDPYILEQMR